MPSVLFLCTGNYYRSRFAEHLFNHLAPNACPAWHATSRALALERGSGNVGPISPLAVSALDVLGIPLTEPQRMPSTLDTEALDQADHIVAVKEAEHRPLLETRFADWCARRLDQVEFWDVDDIEFLDADRALGLIRINVEALCRRLAERAAIR